MGISIPQLLIILAIVLVLFGAKRIKNLGADLGGAVRGFRKAMDEDDKPAVQDQAQGQTFEAKAEETKEDSNTKS